MSSRQNQAQILHESGGHRNARDTYREIEAAGMQVHHLKRYILAHQCKWCQSNLGRKTYQPLSLAKMHQITMAPDHPAWSKTCGKLEASGGLKQIPSGLLTNMTRRSNPRQEQTYGSIGRMPARLADTESDISSRNR